MTSKRFVPLVAAAVVVGVVAVAAYLGHGSTTGDSIGGDAPAITEPVVIKSYSGATFTPLPDEQPPLTAEAAWRRYSGQQIPGSISPYYGKLTWPGTLVGEEPPQYVYKDKPVWGYRSEGACAISELPDPNQPPTCVDWIFLNASTGSHLIETEEH